MPVRLSDTNKRYTYLLTDLQVYILVYGHLKASKQ